MLPLIISIREFGPNSDWPGPFGESLNVFRASSVHLPYIFFFLSSNFEVQNPNRSVSQFRALFFSPSLVPRGRRLNDKGDHE